jgi:hypothetical protein
MGIRFAWNHKTEVMELFPFHRGMAMWTGAYGGKKEDEEEVLR